MKKTRILGIVLIAVLILLIGSGVAMGAGSALATIYTYLISPGNLAVQEPLVIRGSLDPLSRETFYPGEDVISGQFVIENTSPVAYGITITVQNNSTQWPAPILAARAEVIRMAAPTEMVQPYRSINIDSGEPITVRVYVFVPHDSPVGKIVSPTLIFNRGEPPGERG